MSVDVEYKSQIKAKETLETNVPAADTANRKVTHDKYDTDKKLSAPTVSKVAAFEKALVAGAGTIDLTALLGTNGATVDGTGLKVQLLKVRNKSTNTNPITLQEGAANGYELLGDTWKARLQPGQEMTFWGDSKSPAIGATAKNIDLTGTGTEVLECIVVMG